MLSEDMRKALGNMKIYTEDGQEISEIGEITLGGDMSESLDNSTACMVPLSGNITFAIAVGNSGTTDEIKRLIAQASAAIKPADVNVLVSLREDFGQKLEDLYPDGPRNRQERRIGRRPTPTQTWKKDYHDIRRGRG